MKFLSALTAILSAAAAAASEAANYKNARVFPNVLAEESASKLADHVGAIRNLRSSDGSSSYGRGNRRIGEAAIPAADLHRMLQMIGDSRHPVNEETVVNLRTTLVTGDTPPHKDFKTNAGDFGDDEQVMFVFLNTNPGAYFQIGEDKIPVEKGTMVFFGGNSIVHNTVVSSGEVRLLGPIASRDLQGVGRTLSCGSDVCPLVRYETNTADCCSEGTPVGDATTACDPMTDQPGICCFDVPRFNEECGLTQAGQGGPPINNCGGTRTMISIRCPTRNPTTAPTSTSTHSPTSSPSGVECIDGDAGNLFPVCPGQSSYCDGHGDCTNDSNMYCDCPAGEAFCAGIPVCGTKSPTGLPTASPSRQQTNEPTGMPTIPTKEPTDMPTNDPTGSPTLQPTKEPTHEPSMTPSALPTISPTSPPTHGWWALGKSAKQSKSMYPFGKSGKSESHGALWGKSGKSESHGALWGKSGKTEHKSKNGKGSSGKFDMYNYDGSMSLNMEVESSLSYPASVNDEENDDASVSYNDEGEVFGRRGE